MVKSYTDQLAEWAKKRDASRPRQDKNVVAFLAVRTEVKEAMDAGYALKTIWEHMHELGKIPYRYETFLKHVRRCINERLMQDSAAAQQEILDRFKSEMEEIAHRWGDDAKNKAERTLNAALAASKDAMLKRMQERGPRSRPTQ